MELPILDSSEWTLEQQLRKVSEEHHEVMIAGDYYPDLASELWDLIQASLTTLQILEDADYSNNFIKRTNNFHNLKLRQRNKEGRIKIIGKYELKRIGETNENT